MRREGLSDFDDPSAHAGLAQHAYPVDRDEQAICGYRPPRRRSLFGSGARVELAVASSLYNPSCERCVSVVGGPPDAKADTIATVETPAETSLWLQDQTNDEPLTTELLAPPEAVGHDEHNALVERPAADDMEAFAATNEVPTLRPGGLATVEPGSDSLTLRGSEIRAGVAVVASLQGAPRGLRVVSVAVHGRGLASVVLNRKVQKPVQVAWFVVSPSAGHRQARTRAA